MKIPGSFWAALVITAIIAAYFLFSMIFRAPPTNSEPVAERTVMSIQVREVAPEQRAGSMVIRGRTSPRSSVTVRAETSGQVLETPATEGSRVKIGTLLCRLAPDSRQARIQEANAALRMAELDLDAARKLEEQGFGSPARTAAALAVHDQAKAGLNLAEQDFANIFIRAPIDGTLNQLLAEPGDFLGAGSPCAILADLGGIKFSGTLSEFEAAQAATGDAATITLRDGTTLDGEVTYIAAEASGATRSYTIEISADNPGPVLAGQTAEAEISTGTDAYWNIPHSALVNNDDGVLGVRVTGTADAATGISEVHFLPVSGFEDAGTGLWIRGLDGTVNLIVRGQDYVSEGRLVKSAPENGADDG